MRPEDGDHVLAAIALGIDVARQHMHKLSETQKPDDFTAYCVTQELRRAGFAIVRKSDLIDPNTRF